MQAGDNLGARLWRVSEVPGKRGAVSVPLLRRAAAQVHELQFEAHEMWMDAICCDGMSKIMGKVDSEGFEADAGALADRIFPAARDALGADVIYWLTKAQVACSRLPDPHSPLGLRAAKRAKWFGRSCRQKEEHFDGAYGAYTWQPDWLALPAVPLLGGLEDVLLHCKPSPQLREALMPAWNSMCCSAPDLGTHSCEPPLIDVWLKYEQLHSGSERADSTEAVANLVGLVAHCERQLRRALAAVMLGRIVHQNLAAIKERLWHPQGRLMQERNAQHATTDTAPDSSASRAGAGVVVPSKRSAT